MSNELKESKEKYFHNYFPANSQNMKTLWSGIKITRIAFYCDFKSLLKSNFNGIDI